MVIKFYDFIFCILLVSLDLMNFELNWYLVVYELNVLLENLNSKIIKKNIWKYVLVCLSGEIVNIDVVFVFLILFLVILLLLFGDLLFKFLIFIICMWGFLEELRKLKFLKKKYEN